MSAAITLVECPRDAMQGWKSFIPTDQKIAYINQLLKVGFHTLDCGSFVSAKAIPQMADTKLVIDKLAPSSTKLLVIVANERGALEAADFNQINYLGFPFSISPTFQLRNTNSTIEESWQRVNRIQEICTQHNKELVIYISMGFGNPYGDAYSEEIALQWIEKMAGIGIKTISLADTVGLATAEEVFHLTSTVIPQFKNIQIGVHLHSSPLNWLAKFEAALKAGCLRFDGALKGIGGCPMANDELVGNMDTELMISYLQQQKMTTTINQQEMTIALDMAASLFV